MQFSRHLTHTELLISLHCTDSNSSVPHVVHGEHCRSVPISEHSATRNCRVGQLVEHGRQIVSSIPLQTVDGNWPVWQSAHGAQIVLLRALHGVAMCEPTPQSTVHGAQTASEVAVDATISNWLASEHTVRGAHVVSVVAVQFATTNSSALQDEHGAQTASSTVLHA